MSDKTELPKEWQQEAKNVAEIAGNYLQGAKAMRDAMEKELNRRIEFRQKAHDKFIRTASKTANSAAIKTLKGVLKSLTSLTPTQDEK